MYSYDSAESSVDEREDSGPATYTIVSTKLQKVLKGLKTKLSYRTGYTYDHRMVFDSPFHSLFFAREELATILKKTPTVLAHIIELQDLVSWIDEHFKEDFAARAELLEKGEISYSHLWMLFPPGELIYECRKTLQDDVIFDRVGLTEDWNPTAVYETPNHPPSFCINHRQWLYYSSASQFCLIKMHCRIPKFAGKKPLTVDSLGVFPFTMLPDSEQKSIRDRLTARAKTYIEICNTPFSIWQYEGPLRINDEACDLLLDAVFNQDHPAHQNWMVDERVIVDMRMGEKVTDASTEATNREFLDTLLPVADPDRVEWDANPLHSIISPQKDTIADLVGNYSPHSRLRASGRARGGPKAGLVFLLNGPPDACWDLVSAVAESAHKPFVHLDVFDYIAPRENPITNLTRVLEELAQWQPVVLLENCGSVMEQRTFENHLDMARNCTGFIKLLNFYPGALFLLPGPLAKMDSVISRMSLMTVEVVEAGSTVETDNDSKMQKNVETEEAIETEEAVEKENDPKTEETTQSEEVVEKQDC
ncbi:hypothetical protein B0T17DRAFT_364962 [Bombardia bombarda]|uniref:DUF7025 domain-containing protein n=1 Tax=Bombardia bombarda TaxID=252184 RepID=A0AA39WII3_9PEZI|nr:hypothetical protein B0T17DRAFT_364962 [Bombardia bombarda]